MLASHPRELISIGCFLLSMAGAAVVGLRSWWGPTILAPLSVAWLGVDKLWPEDGVLLAITSQHGITRSDVPGLLGLVIAAVEAAVLFVRRR